MAGTGFSAHGRKYIVFPHFGESGGFSGVIEVEHWSQTVPITFLLLIYHPLPLQLYTHTLTVRCGLSSQIQFQTWSVLQQQSRGYSRSSMARLQKTTAKPRMEKRRIGLQPVYSFKTSGVLKARKKTSGHCPPPLSKTPSPLTSPATSIPFNPRPF